MHPLHAYVAEKLAERLRAKKLVVWYDPRSEFAPFVAEVRGRLPGWVDFLESDRHSHRMTDSG